MKVLRSLLHPQDIAAVVERNYPLTNVRCELIKPGINDTYRVWSDETDAVLRVSPTYSDSRGVKAVAVEATWVNKLQKAGVPTLRAYHVEDPDLTDWDHELDPTHIFLMVTPEGERTTILFTMAPGVPLNNTQTTAAVTDYGEALAKLHVISDSLSQDGLFFRPRWDAYGLVTSSMRSIADRLGNQPDDVAALRAIADRVIVHLKAIPQEPPLWGPIHGDTDASNVFVDKGGTVTLIDFDYFGLGYRAYDLAAFVDELRVYWPQTEDYESAFIMGYERVRKIEAAEWAALPYLLAARKLFVLSLYTSHLDVWGRFRLTDRYISGIVQQATNYLHDLP